MRLKDYEQGRRFPPAGANASTGFGNTAGASTGGFGFGSSGNTGFGGTSGTSPFGGASNTAGGSAFGSAFGSKPAGASPFGGASTTTGGAFGANNQNQSPFGSSNTGNAFGGGATSTFGSSGTSAFGKPSTGFGASTGGAFGSSNTGGGLFGSGGAIQPVVPLDNNLLDLALVTITIPHLDKAILVHLVLLTIIHHLVNKINNSNKVVVGYLEVQVVIPHLDLILVDLHLEVVPDLDQVQVHLDNRTILHLVLINQQQGLVQLHQGFIWSTKWCLKYWWFIWTTKSKSKSTATRWGLFGAKPTGTSMFGQSNANTGGIFGQQNQQQPQQSGGLFGSKPATGGLFGGQQANQQQSGGLFGQQNQQQQQAGGFVWS